MIFHCKCRENTGRVVSEPGESEEKGKWPSGREKTGNNDKNTQNWEKTGINLGSVKCRSAPKDKTRNTIFHVADVLPKLIG